MNTPTDETTVKSENTSSNELSDVETRVIALLVDRVEQLARELGRHEGRQVALEQQISRLELQMETLQRSPGQGS